MEEANAKNSIILSNRMTFHYHRCIELGRKNIKDNQLSYADFFLYIALLSPSIDLSSYLECISLRSYIYFSLKDIQMLLLLSMKTLKLFPKILLIEDSHILSDVIKILNRTAIIMIGSNEYQNRTIIPLYLMTKAKELIDCNKNCKLADTDLEFVGKTYADAKAIHLKQLNKDKEIYENVIDTNTKQFIAEKKQELYKILEEQMEHSDFTIDGSNIPLKGQCYLISNNWLRNYIEFLDKMLLMKNSPNDYINYFNTAFDINKQCDYFTESTKIKEEDIYMGPINNFWLAKHKEQWYDFKGSYSNDYTKSSLEKEKYSIVSHEQWDYLASNYDYINSIQRFKLSTGEIEIHLREIKVMVLDKNIFNEHPTLIYPRSIQLSKEEEGTIDVIVNKVYSILNRHQPQTYSIYEVNINKMDKEKRKQMIMELMLAYSLNGNNAIVLNQGRKIDKEKQSIAAIENKSLIIIESGDDSMKSIRIDCNDNERKCNCCKQSTTLFQCAKCNSYIINKTYYCSVNCQQKDKHHHQYHKELSSFISHHIINTSSNRIDYKSLTLQFNDTNTNPLNGLVGFRNLGNTCFMNSALQCLSHCEDLTAYFLSKEFKHNINSSSNGTKGEIVNAYYKLLKRLWLGDYSVLSPGQFKGIFNYFVHQFADSNQHDSQEVLTFILDKIHEDLNRIHKKPYIEMNNYNSNDTDKEASDKWWERYKRREDSVIVDLFHGQFKSKIICSQCNNVSMTFDPFVFLSLPIPTQSILIQYRFFPLINFNTSSTHSYKNKRNRRKKDSNANQAAKKFTLANKSYELLLSDKTIINDFMTPILKDYSDKLNANILFDFVLLKPNKEFDKVITASNQLRDSFEQLLQGYELCIYERQEDKQNVFVYPCDFIQTYRWFIIPSITVEFLSYPLAIPISIKDHVKDLYAKLDYCFQSILDITANIINKNKDEYLYSNQYKLFLYNTNQSKLHWFSPGYIFKSLLDQDTYQSHIEEDTFAPCDYCGNSQCTYCDFASKFAENEPFNYIFSIKTPLVIYAHLFSYDHNMKIYNNIPIPLSLVSKTPLTKTKEITLYDCLDLFTSEESLDDDNKWYCSKCKMHQKAKKKLDIYTLPPYLIIQLKRFQSRSGYMSYGKKNFAYVDFPIEGLDLGKYIPNVNKGNNSNSIYDLIAISEHYGQLSSGHYVAECKNKGEWYEFDDTSVTIRDKNNLAMNAAYILFYKLR